MQNYIKDWLKSRDKTIEGKLICEFEWCNCKISDIHHILSSFRWPRKNSPDWLDLIWVCREHHNWIHSHNNFDTRQMLLLRVNKLCLK